MTFDGPTLLGVAAIIGSITGVIAALGVVLNVVLTFILSSRQEHLAHEMNSVKDALVASTAKASHAEGMADQRAVTEAANP